MEGFEGDGLQFYRCVLCGHVVSVWDIQEVRGCPKCKNNRIRPTELAWWEKVVEIFKHPRVWQWGKGA